MRQENRIYTGDVMSDNTHGRDYEKYTLLISKCVTIKDILNISDTLANINDPAQLTESDLTEFREKLTQAAEDRTAKLSDIRMFVSQVKRLPELKKEATYQEEEEQISPQPPKKRKRKKEDNHDEHSINVRSLAYRYQTPQIENATVMGETFTRDYELERTIKENGLLTFPDQWYEMPPSRRAGRYGWNMATGMIEAVEHQHRFTWQDLIKKYNIPKDYVDGWKSLVNKGK